MENQTETKQPTHALVDVQLFDIIFKYLINRPMAEVEQIVTQIRTHTELVTLPEKDQQEQQEQNEES